MDRTQHMGALLEQVRARSALIQACCRRAAEAHDPQLKSARIDVIVHVVNASARTGAATADLKWAPQSSPPGPRVRLRLPRLPSLPEIENTPLPLNESAKQPPGCLAGKSAAYSPKTGRRRLRPKPKGGAPRGNRNAQKPGCHSRAFQEFRRALTRYVRTLNAQLTALRALRPRQRKRIFYEVVTSERCYVRTRRASPPSSEPVRTAWCAAFGGGVHVGSGGETGSGNHHSGAVAGHCHHPRVHR